MPTITTKRKLNAALLATAASAALLLTACGKADEERTVGQQVDSAVATAEQKTGSAREGLREEVAEAGRDASQASADLRQRAETAAGNVVDRVQDATITASVNAELAKDADLSALRIDVDTVGGKVVLKGSAPNPQARERATRLASNVQGVTSVDNRLEIRG